jgi:hypothetical protein
MSEINLNDVTSGYNLVKINNNFQTLERVINEELLHRVNVDNIPNNLQTDIDANSRHIYNLGKPTTGGEPLRLKDLFGDPDELLQGPEREEFTAVAGQTVFTVSSTYVPGSDSIVVHRNGVLLSQTEYVETSTNVVTLNTGVDAGDIITISSVAVTGGSSGSSSSITASNVGTGVAVYKQKVSDNLTFKTLKAGTNITITPSENEVLISGVAANANGSNLGSSGEGVFASATAGNLSFKKLKAGANVSLSSDSDSITITSSGGGGSASIPVSEAGVLKTSAVSSFNFINSTVGVSGSDITITGEPADYLNVKKYGAVGDGVTNDSTAIQSAITAAQAANKSLFFPDGVYVISSLGTQSGRLMLIGTGNSTLKGTLTYHEPSFPTSADTSSPLTPTSDFFSARGINFQSTTSDYALKLSTVQQPSFLSTFDLINCKFFGHSGVLCQHMIGFQLVNCEFNNSVNGIRLEGCNNGVFTVCRWQNMAGVGVYITKHATETNRAGGENMKFVGCEWAVCTYGIIADEHMWLTIDSCLLDYCDVPLFLSGSNWSKAINTYFGAASVASSRFSAVSGYVAPNISGCAVYGRPSGYPVGVRGTGFTAHNCEFVNYISGATQPLVYIDGYVNGTYPLSAQDMGFYDCLFLQGVSHGSQRLLEVSNASSARVIGNRFESYNKSTSLLDAYRTNAVMDWINHSNCFRNCTQSGVMVRSAYEQGAGTIVSSSEPGSPYPNLIWVQP